MSLGWHSRLDGLPPDTPAVALVVNKDFPDQEALRDALAAAPAGTLFVVRDKDEAAKAALKGLALPYVSAVLNPFWSVKVPVAVWKRHTSGELRLSMKMEAVSDRRSAIRAEEMLNTCHRVIVFTTPKSTLEDDFLKTAAERKNLRVVTRGGKPAKKHRKGRKVE